MGPDVGARATSEGGGGGAAHNACYSNHEYASRRAGTVLGTRTVVESSCVTVLTDSTKKYRAFCILASTMQRFLSLVLAVRFVADARLGDQIDSTDQSEQPLYFNLGRPAIGGHPGGPCERQEVFDIMMCNSHMCTDCVLDWCTEKCQWIQREFAQCVCQYWPQSRTSFSGGNFAGKGKFGDESDYAHAGFRSRNSYGDDHTAQGFRDGSDAEMGMSASDWTPEGIAAHVRAMRR